MFDDDEESPESGVLPEIPDPSPEIPDVEPEIPDASDAPPELKRAFWRLVLVFNLALLATSLGVMLVGFEGRLRDGGALVAVGLAAFAYGLWRYRNRPRFERGRTVKADSPQPVGMGGELKLNELESALSKLSYPVSRDEVRDELGGMTLRYADGEEPLADVVGRIQPGRFGSRDELQSEIYNHLPTEAVGEPGQSEGEG